MQALVARVFLCLIVGIAVVAAVLAIVGEVMEARERRRAERERGRYHWDPALCPHAWEPAESGACEEVPGAERAGSRPTWEVEVCSRCGARRFSCTLDGCPRRGTCRAEHEAGAPEPGELERHHIDRVADAHGFEYEHCRLRDRFGNEREAWCRIIPTTVAFSCPDCGGMVVGVDVPRVWPGTAAPEPTGFRCEQCGRQETHEFGVPRVMEREANPQFTAPPEVQPACPRGGRHEWELLEEWSEMDFPEGVDGCLENLHLVEEVWHQRLRCTKCGEQLTT